MLQQVSEAFSGILKTIFKITLRCYLSFAIIIFTFYSGNRVWWFTLITTTLRRLRQEDHCEFKTSLHSEFWASLSYGVRACLKVKETKQTKTYSESLQSI